MAYYYNYHPWDEQPVDFKKQRPPDNLGFAQENEFQPVNIKKVDGKLLDNIVDYNRNLTEDEINGTNVNNITKFNNLLTLSQFDKMLIAKQYEKLYGKSREANYERTTEWENGRFINMSVGEIVDKFGKTMMDLLQEVPHAVERGEFDWQMIFREDRVIYVGMLMIIIGIFLYFVGASS